MQSDPRKFVWACLLGIRYPGVAMAALDNWWRDEQFLSTDVRCRSAELKFWNDSELKITGAAEPIHRVQGVYIYVPVRERWFFAISMANKSANYIDVIFILTRCTKAVQAIYDYFTEANLRGSDEPQVVIDDYHLLRGIVSALLNKTFFWRQNWYACCFQMIRLVGELIDQWWWRSCFCLTTSGFW